MLRIDPEAGYGYWSPNDIRNFWKSMLHIPELARYAQWSPDDIREFLESMLRDSKLVGYGQWSPDEVQSFWENMLRISPELLIPQRAGLLHMALKTRNHCFVQAFLNTAKYHGPDEIIGLLSTRTSEGNCLHLAIKYCSPHTTTMIKTCKNFGEMFVDQDTAGRTPLHLAVMDGDYSDEILPLLLLYGDEALRIEDRSKYTPYIRRIEGKDWEAVAYDRVAFYIRCYCLRVLDDVKISQALGSQALGKQVQRIDFDLTNVKGNSISEGYLSGILNLISFESTLRLVKLPNLAGDNHFSSPANKMVYVYSFTSKLNLY
jgi:hypothetical protein